MWKNSSSQKKIVTVVVVILIIWLIYWFFVSRGKQNPVVPQPSNNVPQPSHDFPVAHNVDLARYAGKWYEIARTPVAYEKGCKNSTVEYTLNGDGTLNILKECIINGQQDEAFGIAVPENGMLIPGTNILKQGILRASFDGKNFDDFIIIVLDPNYQYSMVGSRDKKNLWIWSRTPKLSPNVYQSLVNHAGQIGFPVNSLVSGQ